MDYPNNLRQDPRREKNISWRPEWVRHHLMNRKQNTMITLKVKALDVDFQYLMLKF